jgi:predicted MFS family arabinose efflux permease
VFAYGSAIDYLGCAILPLLFGWVLDDFSNAWRWVFFSSAVISLISTPLLFRLPINHDRQAPEPSQPPMSWKTPWVNAWNLLRERPDFARYQLGFMFGGAGLVIMQTTLPQYFMDVLKLSYTELALALALFKGTGYALTSPFWAKWFNRVDIYRFSGWVTITASIFPACLILSQWNIAWLYFGYFMYGVMQGGSELSWSMSGPVFAKDKDSSSYSSVNVLTVGLRGCVVPAAGSILYQASNASSVLVVGALLCLLATQRMMQYCKEKALVVTQQPN